jgi:hypothetical protein
MNTDVGAPPAVRGPEAGTVVLTVNGQVRELPIEPVRFTRVRPGESLTPP